VGLLVPGSWVPLENVDHQADAVDPPDHRGILTALSIELGTELNEAVDARTVSQVEE